MQGKSDPNRELLDAAALCGHLVPAGSVCAFLACPSQALAKQLAKWAAKYLVFQYWNDRLEVVSLVPAMPAVGGSCPGPQSLGRAMVRAERAEMSEMHLSVPCRAVPCRAVPRR